MPVTKKRVGKEEAKSLFLKYYENSTSSMVRDINTKSKKTLKPNAKNSWKYRNNPSKYDMKGIDDDSNTARQWIMNRFFRHMNSISTPKTAPVENDISYLKNEIETSRSIIKNLNSQIKTYQEEKRNSSSDVRNTYNASISELKKVVEDQKAIIAALKENLSGYEQRVALLKSEYDNKISQALAKSELEYSQIIKKLKQEHETAITNLKKEKDALVYELKQVQQATANVTGDKSAIQTELSTLKQQLADQKKTIAQLELQNKDLRQEGKSASQKIASELEAKEEAIASYVTKINNLQERIAKQDQALTKNQETISDLSNKLNKALSNASTNPSVVAQQNEKSQKLSEKIKDLENRMQLLQTKKDGLEKNLEKITADLEAAKSDALKKANEYNELSKSINAQKQELENKYVNELQAKQELSDKVKSLTQDRKDKEAIVATLRLQNSNLKKKSKEYENEIASLNSRIEELGTEEAIRNQKASNLNQNAEKELAALKLKLEENDKFILQLNSKTTQQMETISKKDAEIQKLKDYVKQLQEKEAPASDKKELIEFDKVLFNVNGNKGSGSVKVKSIKADPALNLSIKEVHMLILDIFENSQSNDLMIAMYKYLTVNRYEKTSYEIIPDASTSRGQSYKFKIVQPKSMTNDQFNDKIKAFNAILSSTTNYNDSYRLKNKILK